MREIIEDHQVEPRCSSTSEVKEEALNTDNQVPLPWNKWAWGCPTLTQKISLSILTTTLRCFNVSPGHCVQISNHEVCGQKIESLSRLRTYLSWKISIFLNHHRRRMHSYSKHSTGIKSAEGRWVRVRRTKMVEVVTGSGSHAGSMIKIAARAVHPKGCEFTCP